MFSFVRTCSDHRFNPGFIQIRGLCSLTEKRKALLKKVYAPFRALERNDPEYNKLGLSGKVWEEYFQPGDSKRYGYVKLNKLHGSTLREIDSFKESMKLPTSAMVENLVAEYACQSVQIEANPLQLGDSIKINDHLSETWFQEFDLASTSASELAQTSFPGVHHLLDPSADASHVAELRNHIIASQWVTQTAVRNPGTAGLIEDEIRYLSAITIKDTKSEALYASGWGEKVISGGYRQVPIAVRSNPLRIFPYHLEVPALVQRFFQWRDAAIKTELHPLIIACQALVYFLHIHPFPDGNGRVSRLMMQDFMIRHGYIPVTLLGIDRQDYLRMIKNAQDGEPEEFVAQMLMTQLDAMITFKTRELEV